ncbi:MAG: hypothetical protein KF710_01810 [Rhodocyclaceae bacterium]|nr:hypothetical protein [Rhodocyclaceae bacterium]
MLLMNAGHAGRHKVTDANGNYNFSGLVPGDYIVKFIAADGSVLSTANVGDDAFDSDAGADGFTGCYTLSSGETIDTVDAGFSETASIGDKVWVDSNANGVQDAGEVGKAGVTVELYTCVDEMPGTLVDTKVTDANGNYNFSGLMPGDYIVKFIAADGSVLSTANVGDDAFDSDAGADGFTGCYTLTSGENNTTVDAGFYETGSIGDRVWVDANGNGVQDAGEVGKAGVTVELYTCVDEMPGTLVDTKVTDANGNYNFSGLVPGDYIVKFIAADGSVLSTANVGDDAFDSDAGADGFWLLHALLGRDHRHRRCRFLGNRLDRRQGVGRQQCQRRAGRRRSGQGRRDGRELYTCDMVGLRADTKVTDASSSCN